MKNIYLSNIQRQLGVTLIEAMVSLFIFSVGALGIAALQTTTLTRGGDTKQRSIAIWKAQELVDKIRSTKTINDPGGALDEYVFLIGNGNTGIGTVATDATDVLTCPETVPQRCDDQNGTDIAACNAEQMRAFEFWSVMCDANTGLAVVAAAGANVAAGSAGLRDLEVALDKSGTDYRLYFEWLSRSASNNADEDGIDTGLQNRDGSARNVVTTLCGEKKNVDSRLDVYCVRFQ